MKVEIGLNKKSQLEVLKNKFLLFNNNLTIISDFKIIEELYQKKTFGIKRGEPVIKLFVVSMTVLGYNKDGKFVGTHSDETCWRMLSIFDLYYMRKQWTDLCDALKAFGFEVCKLKT
jgi:hypothetical protein